jgi:D-sedoheptulose 7-phosphate isomerase
MTILSDYKRDLLKAIVAIDEQQVSAIADVIIEKARLGAIFIIGNGGSAAIASHFACDLGKGCTIPGHKRFNVHSLTDNTPWMTAISNDFSYEDVFVAQLENFVGPDDLLISISSSGNSPNIIKAMKYAKEVKAETVAFVGFKGGGAKDLADHCIWIDSMTYGVVEDAHSILEHMVTTEIRTRLEATPV